MDINYSPIISIICTIITSVIALLTYKNNMSNQEQEYLQNENQEEGENINLSDNNLTDVNDVLLKFPNPELIISVY